jgi:hypothetical protein
MDNHTCPNTFCGDALNTHQGTRALQRYCPSCGFEDVEPNDVVPGRSRPDPDPGVVSLLSKKAQQEQRAKVKPSRDRENYVPARGGRR